MWFVVDVVCGELFEQAKTAIKVSCVYAVMVVTVTHTVFTLEKGSATQNDCVQKNFVEYLTVPPGSFTVHYCTHCEKGSVLKKRRPRKNKKKYLGLWGGDLEAPAQKFWQLQFLFTMPLAPKNIFYFFYCPDPSIKKKADVSTGPLLFIIILL